MIKDNSIIHSFARVYGFKNIAMFVSMCKKQKMSYQAIEIMACPSGCLNGPA